jgi:AcrR family transcriptional regulator
MATPSQRERAEATRRTTEQALLTAAVELLGEGIPYADIGIEQIVRRAGFSRPTFYAYFRDKRELVLRLGAALQTDVGVAADPWLEREEGDVRTTLAAVLDVFVAHRGTLSALVEAATYDSEVNAFWHAFHDRFKTTAAARITRAFGDLPRSHVEARAFTLIWMTERTLTEYLAGSEVDGDALLDELARIWDAALARP